jgi:hypothetical protein
MSEMTKMKNNLLNKILLLLTISIFTISCKNYESEKYILNENEAIIDIIPDLIDLNNMISMNNFKSDSLNLYVNSTLHNNNITFNEQNDSFLDKYENDSLKEIFNKEKTDFKAFTEKSIKPRNLNIEIKYSNLNIIIISSNEHTRNITKTYNEKSEIDKNIFGSLDLSRIIFDEKYEIGYLSYGFYCGEGCFWSSNIQIRKINGKWKISETYSGGIA